MAAEDYIDDCCIGPFDDRYAHEPPEPRYRVIPANGRIGREVVWTTRDGEQLRLHEMETSHLVNTISLIKRKMAEHDQVCIMAAQRNMTAPPFSINDNRGEFWIEHMLQELGRRG